MYKNGEGYHDPTAGKAMRKRQYIPDSIWSALRPVRDILHIAGLNLLEIEVEDRRSKKRYRWRR